MGRRCAGGLSCEPGDLSVSGTLKWFDVTRGFGFLVADDRSISATFSSISRCCRRMGGAACRRARASLPRVRRERGMQASEILSIDLSNAVETDPRGRAATTGAIRASLVEDAGPFEPVRGQMVQPVEGLWISRARRAISRIYSSIWKRCGVPVSSRSSPTSRCGRASSRAARGRSRWWSKRKAESRHDVQESRGRARAGRADAQRVYTAAALRPAVWRAKRRPRRSR